MGEVRAIMRGWVGDERLSRISIPFPEIGGDLGRSDKIRFVLKMIAKISLDKVRKMHGKR